MSKKSKNTKSDAAARKQRQRTKMKKLATLMAAAGFISASDFSAYVATQAQYARASNSPEPSLSETGVDSRAVAKKVAKRQGKRVISAESDPLMVSTASGTTARKAAKKRRTKIASDELEKPLMARKPAKRTQNKTKKTRAWELQRRKELA